MAGQWEQENGRASHRLLTVHHMPCQAVTKGVPAMRSAIGLTSPIKLYPGNPVLTQTPSRGHTGCNVTAHLRSSSINTLCHQIPPAGSSVAKPLLNDMTVDKTAEHNCLDTHLAPTKAANQYSRNAVQAATVCQLNSSTMRSCKKPLLLHKRLEHDRNMAVLLMEKQVAQLNTELEESKQLQRESVNMLQEATVLHQQKLTDMKAVQQSQLEAMQSRIARHLQQQKQRRMLQVSLAAFSQHKWRQKSVRGLRQRMQQRQLLTCCLAWAAVAKHSRAKAYQQSAADQALMHLQKQHLQQVMAAWQACAVQQHQQREQQFTRAARWQRHRMLRKAYHFWHGMCMEHQAAIAAGVACSNRLLMSRALQAWAQGVDESSVQSSSTHRCHAELAPADRLQRAMQAWLRWTALQRKCKQLQQMHQQRLMHSTWQQWSQLAATAKAQCGLAAAAFTAMDCKLRKQWGVQAFQQHLQETHAQQLMKARRLQQCLLHWKQQAAAAARQHRILAAAAAAKMKSLIQQCFVCWWRHVAVACRQKAATQVNKLQEALNTQQYHLQLAQTQEAAATEQMKLLVMHNQSLQQQAVDACKGALASMQFVPCLQWRSLPFSPGEACIQPRARHAVLRLSALQPQSAATPLQAGLGAQSWEQRDASSCDCLLLFGGVSGSQWLTDLTLLVLQDGTAGNISLKAVPVPCSNSSSSSSCSRPGCCSANTEPAEQTMLPVPVRDFAACACGHNQFVLSGGFDGQKNRFDLQLCTMQHQMQNSETKVKAEDAHAECGIATASWCEGWEACWQLLQPRNPSPVGRCHHTICYYPEGSSLVVFGGWADKLGCLNDVWLFHMDHMEWWQPEMIGPHPSHRRSHAAALLGHTLYIHGGRDGGGGHMSDLWCLDLQNWQWSQLAPGDGDGCSIPPARRAHSMEVFGQRYLLLHGGYAGEGLLSDTWVFDTQKSKWLMVEMQAPASEYPVPRALHTLTALGNHFVAIGGQGPLGPLADVSLLECPAVQQGLRLQQMQQQSQSDLVQAQRRCIQLDADLACIRTELQAVEQTLQIARQQVSQLTAQHAAAMQAHSALEASLREAHNAAAAAQQSAQEAQQQVAALERRLLRARQGGNKAVQAAQSLSERLKAAEAAHQFAQQQLLQAQQQVKQQQLSLNEHHAEVAVLRSQLAESQSRANIVAAASSSARSDYQIALSRSNQLYTQELKHLRGMLQAARKAQKQLADELAQLQAQQAAAKQAPPDNELTTEQQQQSCRGQDTQTAALVAMPGSGDSNSSNQGAPADIRCVATRRNSSDDGSLHVSQFDQGWENGLCFGGPCALNGQLVCMSADQLADISSRQGRLQAQVELLQQQVKLQQTEISSLKQQLQLEQNAASAANELRAAAVRQLHLAEQAHQHQLMQLEGQLQQYKWQLWELETDLPRAVRRSRCSDVSRHMTSDSRPCHNPDTCGVSQESTNAVQANPCELCDAAAESAIEDVVSAGLGAAPESESPMRNLLLPDSQGRFSVHLVPKAGLAEELEMLPEVVQLFELHRSTMV